MNEFGKRLRERRKKAGLTQAEAASLAGMSRSRYAELEQFGNKLAEMLPKLADALGCGVGDFFPEMGEVPINVGSKAVSADGFAGAQNNDDDSLDCYVL